MEERFNIKGQWGENGGQDSFADWGGMKGVKDTSVLIHAVASFQPCLSWLGTV